MKRIVLKHLSGSKANQVEEFPLNHFEELVIGRDPSATVKFDPDKDDLVGRQHAKIMRDGPDSPQFMIKDLGSRNGTYLNKERIIGAANIAPGDVVQFGPGGPELQFDLEPRPENMVRPTRVGAASEAQTALKNSPPATRVADSLAGASAAAAVGSNGGRTGVGKATVMRMVSQSKSESRRNVAIVASVLLLVVAVGIAGTVWWTRMRTQSQPVVVLPPAPAPAPAKDTMSPADITAAYTSSTVFIQHSWKLIEAKSGLPLFFKFFQNAYKDKKDGKVKPIVEDKRGWVAAYKVINANGGQIIEPYLTTETGGVYPLGYSGSGTGFVVTGDGFILTNKHVAESWKSTYPFWGDQQFQQLFFPGILYRCDTGGNCADSPIADETGKPQLFTDINLVAGWIPAATVQFGYSQLGSSSVIGRNDSLYITFPNTENRIPAGDVRSSDRHDVAIMKINVASPLKPVELNDNYDTIKPGEAAVVLGYPGGSPPQFAVITSKAGPGYAQESQFGIVPNATLSVGNISRILRNQEGTQGKDTVQSTFGDVYQLTINTTGHGNSGGPVFDDHGKVIAVFTYGMGDPTDFRASAAVPIRYAKELMGVTPIMNK